MTRLYQNPAATERRGIATYHYLEADLLQGNRMSDLHDVISECKRCDTETEEINQEIRSLEGQITQLESQLTNDIEVSTHTISFGISFNLLAYIYFIECIRVRVN